MRNFTQITLRGVDGDNDTLDDADQRKLSDALAYLTKQAIDKVAKADVTLVVASTGEPMVSVPPDMSIFKKFDHVSIFSMQKLKSVLREKMNGPEEPMAYGDFTDEE